jgi:hypothetical protein
MNRNLYLMLGAGALIALAACTVKSETSGTGGHGGSGNTGGTHAGGSGGVGNTGGGGSAACISCNEYLQCAAQSCEPNTCAGPATTAYDALLGCLCTACVAECPTDFCLEGTAGAGGGSADTCGTCMATNMGNTCSAEVGTCTNN